MRNQIIKVNYYSHTNLVPIFLGHGFFFFGLNREGDLENTRMNPGVCATVFSSIGNY
jgi:hypothetical protein